MNTEAQTETHVCTIILRIQTDRELTDAEQRGLGDVADGFENQLAEMILMFGEPVAFSVETHGPEALAF